MLHRLRRCREVARAGSVGFLRRTSNIPGFASIVYCRGLFCRPFVVVIAFFSNSFSFLSSGPCVVFVVAVVGVGVGGDGVLRIYTYIFDYVQKGMLSNFFFLFFGVCLFFFGAFCSKLKFSIFLCFKT